MLPLSQWCVIFHSKSTTYDVSISYSWVKEAIKDQSGPWLWSKLAYETTYAHYIVVQRLCALSYYSSLSVWALVLAVRAHPHKHACVNVQFKTSVTPFAKSMQLQVIYSFHRTAINEFLKSFQNRSGHSLIRWTECYGPDIIPKIDENSFMTWHFVNIQNLLRTLNSVDLTSWTEQNRYCTSNSVIACMVEAL